MPPFITPDDEYWTGSKRPKDIGNRKLAELHFTIDMSDEEMTTMAEEAVAMKAEYLAWDEFYLDLDARKKRLLGFQAVTKALDLNLAAQMMNTKPELVAAVMNGNAQQEAARLAELQTMWNNGKLPDRPVITDPSKDVVNTPAPVAAFSFVVDGREVTFTDKSTNNPLSCVWDFGDGNTSIEKNPVYTFEAAGSYTVGLMATNAAGSNTATHVVDVAATA